MAFMQIWYSAVATDCRLFDLEEDVRKLRVPTTDPNYDRHYELWKARLKRFVGWDADKPELRTDEAWDGCHAYLLRVFEDQRNDA